MASRIQRFFNFFKRDSKKSPAKENKASKQCDEGLSYPVEVANLVVGKWKSADATLHSHIQVVEDANDQTWLLERHEDEPKWAFHVRSSNDEKLYITYNDDDVTNQNVTLELESSPENKSKERYFKELVQPGGRIMLASLSKPVRFLGVTDGFLTMVNPDAALLERPWVISTQGQAVTTTYVQINEAGAARKWISDNAHPQNRVQINISSTQNWIYSGGIPKAKFEAPNAGVYASRTDGTNNQDVIFETSSNTPDDYREFDISNAQTPGAVLFQNIFNQEYVGTDDGDVFLEFKTSRSFATAWTMEASHLVFPITTGNSVIFPPIEEN